MKYYAREEEIKVRHQEKGFYVYPDEKQASCMWVGVKDAKS